MSEPRLAAAVILMRPSQRASFEVYLVRRSEKLDFLGGFHAFPGGTTDAADAGLPWGASPDEAARLGTAVRELFEETGVLAVTGGGLAPQQRHDLRQGLLSGASDAFEQALRESRSTIDPAHWIPMGRWVTPPYTPVVFDARYFGVWLPPGEAPEIWPGELTAGLWVTPTEAIQRHERGTLFISYPVLETLRTLERHGADLEAAAVELQSRSATYPHAGGEMITGVRVAPLRTFTLPPATHTNCYVLGTRELVVVDPASPIAEEQGRLVAYLEHLERHERGELRAIWLTHHHRDHVGAVEVVRQRFGVPVLAHRGTAEALAGELRIDGLIEDEQRLELHGHDGRTVTWHALHTPGHARGHLCFWEPALGTLLSGDNVLGLGTVLIAPPEGDMAAYLRSLERMLDRRLGFLFGAHGPPVAAAADRIRGTIAHRQQREHRILEVLGGGPMTPAELVALVYTDVAASVHGLAEINVRAHLQKLVAEGRVDATGDTFARR